MKSEDFYQNLKDFDHVLTDKGFKKRGKSSYYIDDVKLQLILNQWGWDPDLGWGFHARVTDETQRDSLGNITSPQHEIDIRPDYLIKKLNDKQIYHALYDEYPKLKSQLQAGWFAFNNEEHLKKVLPIFLPLIADAALNWKDD